MLETPTSAQNGCCIVTTLGTVSANSEFSLMDSSGNVIMSYTPTKNYASVIVYSSDIKNGSTYTVTAGSTTQSITVNSNVTTNGGQRRLRRWSEWRFWRRTAWRDSLEAVHLTERGSFGDSKAGWKPAKVEISRVENSKVECRAEIRATDVQIVPAVQL